MKIPLERGAAAPLYRQPGLINFTTDRPAPELLPDAIFGRCLRAVMQQDGAAAYAYDAPEGHGPLRQAIARHVVDRGIVANPEEVLVTAGAQQALDLAVRGLVAPGEWVVVESPSFLWAHNTLAVHGVRAAPAPVDEGGLAVDQLEPLLRRLRALGNHVVHAGSFSKSLLPGIRLGYAVAAPEVVRRLALVKQASDVHSPGVLQRALARFLDGGHFAPHLRRVLAEYRRRRAAALAAVARCFPAGTSWLEPAGGLHVWVTLPPEVDTGELYVAAMGAGVGFTPGAIFYPPGGPSHHLRISYGAEPPPRIEQGLARLGALLAQAAAGGRAAWHGRGRRAGAPV